MNCIVSSTNDRKVRIKNVLMRILLNAASSYMHNALEAAEDFPSIIRWCDWPALEIRGFGI